MINKIINLEGIEKEYSFQKTGKESDRYFCSCGEQFVSLHAEEVIELESVLSGDQEMDEMYGNVYKDIKLAMDKKIICPHCEKNYNNPDVLRKLIPIGSEFISGYEFKETDTDLIIYFAKSCPALLSRELEDGTLEYKIDFDESIKYIRFEKESGRILFQDYGDILEVEFDLDEVIKYIDLFFQYDTEKIINLFKLHMYLNRLANFVSDTKNGKIVTEFLEQIRNAPNAVGVTYIKKMLSIFYGIIKFSNLSTIALTKNSQFLYDLMLECEIPSSIEMKNSGITSPVDIFNFLVTKYINKLNEEVNEDNKESIDFSFKSKQRINFENENNISEDDLGYSIEEDNTETNFIVRQNKEYKNGKVVRVDGRFQVLDAVKDGTVSKFIYKHINNFSDYKQLIKYFKFYNKQEVINLMQNHELELLTTVVDNIYFRNRMDLKEFTRVLKIIKTFTEERFFFKNIKNAKDFSFVEYDDAKLMMGEMGFDPKRHFNKIETYSGLVEYHDLLVKYFKVKSEEEKSGAIKNFVSKFSYLETRGDKDYNGPIEIKLLDGAGGIIKEGLDMRHSVISYSPKVAQGGYVLASIYDRDENRPEDEQERFTMGFTYDKYNGLEFDQVKGYVNQLGSDRFKKHVMEFLTAKDVSFRPIKDLKLKDGNAF